MNFKSFMKSKSNIENDAHELSTVMEELEKSFSYFEAVTFE